MELFTCNYASYKPEMGVPVKISNGHPSWITYPLHAALPALYPDWSLVRSLKNGLPHAEFAQIYREGLDQLSITDIYDGLHMIAHHYGDEHLVLLCYESLKGDAICHRTVFGQWWTERTGELVVELTTQPKEPSESEPTLWD